MKSLLLIAENLGLKERISVPPPKVVFSIIKSAAGEHAQFKPMT